MHCHESRHLLSLGVLPGATDPVRTMLGFHLSRCPTCRAYRTQLHNQHLLQMLLTQAPPPPCIPVKARPAMFSNSAAYGLHAAIVVLVGGTLALSPLATGAARAAETSPTASATSVLHRPANASRIARRTSAAPRASLALARQSQGVSAAISASVAEVAPTVNTAVARNMQSAPLQAGVELLIPAVPQSPDEIAAAPAGQVAPLALYVVRAGDNLSGLALQFYGNASLWTAIYNANRGVIGGNPGVLFTGQLLTIPANPSTNNGTQQGTRVVQSGDTLWGIAQSVYGDGSLWRTIYNANATLIGANYNLIFPGQSLTIPAAPIVQASTSNQQRASSASQPGSHTVQSGDTLWGIAQSTYGNGNLWTMIYNANRGVVGGNPDLIYPGQQLTIPVSS